jgi:hypothetical protein
MVLREGQWCDSVGARYQINDLPVVEQPSIAPRQSNAPANQWE